MDIFQELTGDTFESQAEVEFLDSGNREMVPFVALKEIPEHLGELKSLPSQVCTVLLVDIGMRSSSKDVLYRSSRNLSSLEKSDLH